MIRRTEEEEFLKENIANFWKNKHYWLFRNPIQIKPDLRGVLELIEISTAMKEGELYQYKYILEWTLLDLKVVINIF